MKEVLALIEQKRKEYAQLPLMKFLVDESIDPLERLSWAPCFAPFAMTFKDVNAHVFRKEPADSPLQEMINQHSYEDGRHWRWYLEDLEKLGFNESLNFTEALRFLWGEETQKTRLFCYDLLGLCVFEKDPIIKLAVIESIEVTGSVTLSLFVNIGEQIKRKTNHKLHYFSASHYAVETGHIQGGLNYEQTDELLKNIKLTQEQSIKACEAVEIVFDSFSKCMNEMMKYVENHSSSMHKFKTSSIEQIESIV
ncbi:hypothetical protein [Rivularia sp. UHCC 0363]|uniref:hypothetical protein n=1 Tax=Rivularia sp. UHCC 0363 TaxID=3110244 RepID=UPI002B1FDB53|nr:hypothetical protein [Rivularia sp. UHCC 0363]MEA5593876.1 hypothetical protein [Rivularia sp. UHCC 0363]